MIRHHFVLDRNEQMMNYISLRKLHNMETNRVYLGSEDQHTRMRT